MSIKIETIVSIDERPHMRPTKSSKSKKSGVVYPDSLELKVTEYSEYENADGDLVDVEKYYIIEVVGTATVEGITSDAVRELNSLLRSYDYKKFPLQLQCEPFEQGSFYANEVKQFVTDRDTKKTKAKLKADQLLAKLKKQ